MDDLLQLLLLGRCRPVPEGTPVLEGPELETRLELVPEWAVSESGMLQREFFFDNFHETMTFVNAVAWIAHQQDHHPDLDVSYKRCAVNYVTHSIGGLSDNDFSCALKIDAIG